MRRLWGFVLVAALTKTGWADTVFTDLPSGFFGGTSSGSYAYATAGKQRPCKFAAYNSLTISSMHTVLLRNSLCIFCVVSASFLHVGKVMLAGYVAYFA